MEDENITTSTANVEGDVVTEQTPSEGMTPAPEPSTPMMEPSTETTPQTTGAPDYERTQAVQTEQTLAENYINDARKDSYLYKGHGISDWIKNEYNYDQQQAGTMWVAGKINDVATQMSFLEATLNEDMYGELDLQKYFFDTNLATARAYANEKKHETAYGYYRAAQEKALAEGDLIGWYMPAEANYMLSQWAVATEKLKDQNLPIDDRYRAGSVKEAVEGWFNSNNITWRGIECLNSLYLKETIRHNKENERLQEQANKIAAAQNAANRAAAAANYDLQLRTLEFQIAENELDMGWDLDDNNVIGHTNVDITGKYTGDADRFGWYPDMKSWAQDNLDAAFKLWGTNEMRKILGDDYNQSYNAYRAQIDLDRFKAIYNETGSHIIAKENMNTFGNNKLKVNDEVWVMDYGDSGCYPLKIDSKNNQLYIHYNTDGSVKLYVFDESGVAHQLINSDVLLKDGTTSLDSILKNQGLTVDNSLDPIYILDDDNNLVELQIGQQNMSVYTNSVTSKSRESFTGMSSLWNSSISVMDEDSYNTIVKKEAEGYRLLPGVMSTQGFNTPWVMEKDGKYYEVSAEYGDFKEIKNGQTISMTIDPNTGETTMRHADGGSIGNWWQNFNRADYGDALTAHLEKIGYTKDGDSVARYVNPDGSVAYVTNVNMGGFTWENKKFTVISEDEVIKQGILTKDQADKFVEGTYNYNNRVKENTTESKVAKNVTSSEDIIEQANKNLSKQEKEKLEKIAKTSVNGASAGYSSARNVKNANDEAKKSGSSSSKETKEDQVITDSSKETETGDLGEQAKEEIEKNQERYNKLFSVA